MGDDGYFYGDFIDEQLNIIAPPLIEAINQLLSPRAPYNHETTKGKETRLYHTLARLLYFLLSSNSAFAFSSRSTIPYQSNFKDP